MKRFTVIIVLAALISGCSTVEKATQTSYLEKHRPHFHFTPPAKWMNDPNGMVYQLKIKNDQLEDFSIVLSNELGEELLVGYDKQLNQYFIDRSKAGKKDFEKGFATRHTAPRLSKTNITDITLLVDVASVELFAGSGLTVMTDIFFPNKTMNKLVFDSPKMENQKISLSKIKGIW